MATTLPKPPRLSNGPPNMNVPALPMSKTRKSTGNISSSSSIRSAPGTPRGLSGLRAPSASNLPPPSPSPLSGLAAPPKSSAASGSAAAPHKTVRKTVSINSFPQPPRGDTRGSGSLPGSPMTAERPRTARKSKSSRESIYSNYNSGTPSFLNGSGEGKSITSVRMSDGLVSAGSETQSRSSSAQDSYSTSATTFDDPADGSTPKPDTSISDKRASKADGKGNVVVSVRVRPTANGANGNPEGEWMVDGRRSLISYKGKEGGNHFYDNVFTTHDNNSRVYDHIAKRLVRRVMEGYHGTVFAYGMTGTGKTFSMQGTASSPGVIPLAITDIFSYIRETPSREFLLRVSYLEIYNEKIHDLLSMPTGNGVGAGSQQEEIKLREDSKRGVYATPLKEEIVQSPTQLLRVIARGDQARRTASTQFNARSSRSHAVVQIVVESRDRTPPAPGGAEGGGSGGSKRSAILPGGVRVSTLSLIDLAGSEKAAESKERRQEGAHINKSLLTLGTVIARLSESKDKEAKGAEKDTKHLPYRDSKLTRLLQSALAGNSLVSILCTIQVGSQGTTATVNSHTTETLSTLKFASRAKNSIVSHAKKAEESLGAGGEGGARVLLERYRLEISDLRKQLEAQAKKKKDQKEEDDDDEKEDEKHLEHEASERHEEQLLEMQLARTALKERIDHLNRLILSSKSIGVNSNGSLSSLGQNPRFSQVSLPGSVRSSMALSTTSKPLLERTASMTSASSTIGRRSSGGVGARASLHGPEADNLLDHEDDSVGEFGDGTASMAAQNRALQADLADRNRYIATLEKRLLQARRASSSRTSGVGGSSKGIMVGEDHSVSAALREKDAEIADLRARLDDKDRMLTALRSAARSRETAESRTEMRSPISPQSPRPMVLRSARETPIQGSRRIVTSPTRSEAGTGKHRKSADSVSVMLDEMIQDRVSGGYMARGSRTSIRFPIAVSINGSNSNHSKSDSNSNHNNMAEPAQAVEPLRKTPTPKDDGNKTPVPQETA
ncbi:centromeric protein E [Geosmithia morbida]|uniref:Kinesin-like protein KIP2 n=1 Tax=Geosmithia morbida TaxID=1094350 RepID=A0A9P4YX79_9HYPO|nr:centromeric protein E [Geosmithia morbida]KAF4123386.1 centromeric protein E [Geosmithia morbida]